MRIERITPRPILASNWLSPNGLVRPQAAYNRGSFVRSLGRRDGSRSRKIGGIMKVRYTAATWVALLVFAFAFAPFALAQDDKQPDAKPATTDTKPDAKPADAAPADAQTPALPDVVPQKDHVNVKGGSRDDVE